MKAVKNQVISGVYRDLSVALSPRKQGNGSGKPWKSSIYINDRVSRIIMRAVFWQIGNRIRNVLVDRSEQIAPRFRP